MKDFFGNTLEIGDEVAYSHRDGMMRCWVEKLGKNLVTLRHKSGVVYTDCPEQIVKRVFQSVDVKQTVHTNTGTMIGHTS